jgi:hypothetical protein
MRAFGDILVNRDEGHAVRVLFRGQDGRVWVYSKASAEDTDPFQILPIEEAFPKDEYHFDPGRPLASLQVYRHR